MLPSQSVPSTNVGEMETDLSAMLSQLSQPILEENDSSPTMYEKKLSSANSPIAIDQSHYQQQQQHRQQQQQEVPHDQIKSGTWYPPSHSIMTTGRSPPSDGRSVLSQPYARSSDISPVVTIRRVNRFRTILRRNQLNNMDDTDDETDDDDDDMNSSLKREEFDWEADADDGKSDDDESTMDKNRSCMWWRSVFAHMPYWLQCLGYAILGDLIIFGLLGVPDLLFGIKYFDTEADIPVSLGFTDWTSKFSVGDMPLLYWAIYFCISWTLHYATLLALSIVPGLLQRIFGIALGSRFEERLAEYLNYFRVMHRRITISVWIILSNVIWTSFVVVPEWRWRRIHDLSHGPAEWRWYNYVQRVLLTMFVVYTLWTLEKLILEVVATGFHRKAYKSRIIDSREANGYLELLLQAIKSPRPRMPLGTQSDSQSSFINMSENDSKNMNGSKKFNVFNRAGQFIAEQANKTVLEIAKQVKLDPNALATASAIPKSRSRANMMARDLFYALVKPKCNELSVDDFRAYFSSDEEAMRAFNVFDVNRSGCISKSEMKVILNQWMQEKKDIENSIADVTSAVSSLDWFLGAIFIFIMAIISLNFIWQVATDRYLSTLAAVLLPGTFIFGATLKETFECIIYLFTQHYFDVGDTIRFDKEFYRVKAMSILTTTLVRGDGKLVYVPNHVMQTKLIDNVRRSGNMSEDIIIKIDIATTEQQMEIVHSQMFDFLEEHINDYKPIFNWVILEILLSENALLCKVTIEHNINWQTMSKRNARRNAYMFALRQAFLDAGITCPVTGVPEHYDRS